MTLSQTKKTSSSKSNSELRIENTNWKVHAAIALEEARRQAADEEERRKGADNRASQYLVVAAALVPLVTYIQGNLWSVDKMPAGALVGALFLSAGTAFLVFAGVQAFRILKVSTYHRIGTTDLVKIWSAKEGKIERLTKETLHATERNLETINNKVGLIKSANTWLLASFVVFGCYVLMEAILAVCTSYPTVKAPLYRLLGPDKPNLLVPIFPPNAH